MKKQFIKIITAVLLASTTIFAFSSCSKPDSDKTKVRLACFPNITHSQALYGMATDSFSKALGEDCDVSWQTFNAGPSEIEALFAGAIDIGYIGPVPAINGYAKSSGELQIIAGATNAGGILVTRKDLVLKDVSELDGKKIAVPQFGNTQDLLLRDIISKANLKDETKGGTVNIIQSENPNTKLLLDRGDVDAALVPEPWGSRLIKEVGANVLLEYNQIFNDGNYTSALVIVNREFLKNHSDIVEKFLKEHVRLTQYINDNKSDASSVINTKIKELTNNAIPDDILTDAYNRMTITYNPQKESVNNFIETYKNLGLVENTVEFPDIVNLDLLNKVLQESSLPIIEN